jgi:hypothetical protein
MTQLLLLASFASGPCAVWLAARKSFLGGFATILGGFAVGVGGLLASFQANRLHLDAMRQSGQHVLNDMPGFGQALLFAMGVVYFGAALLLAIAATVWRAYRARVRNK